MNFEQRELIREFYSFVRVTDASEESSTNVEGDSDELQLVFRGEIRPSAPSTDPPNKPEYVYAGEYDQEPMTIIPTYTSPEYSANHLIP